ncbi:MAG: hypothetical protein A3G23_04725 [Bacteroidetes bacterium RIFCSPLOWO2_12_FULL_37_12]|nr:MAG: hypothetical protein A3G23_04725 [Bacteroidetes bacterium RIFCSPLOWO2_12_FULL_37_12]
MNIISWFEIPASNFNRAVKFYRNTLEVEIELHNFNGIAHGVFKIPGEPANRITGAIIDCPEKRSDNVGPVLFFSAGTEMVEVLNRIVAEGGKILLNKTLIRDIISKDKAIIPKTLIDHNVGYYAYFLDSEGNKMGLFSNS